MYQYIKNLIATAAILGLFACGGQPDLAPTQSVARGEPPVAADNSEVEVVWRAASGGSELGAVQFKPVVAGDTVYTANHKGRIEGFALDTGKRVFNHNLGSRAANGVGVNNNHLFAVTENGQVIALARSDGEEKWRYDIGGVISAAPAVNERVVIIRSVDGQLIGLNALSGKPLWRVERPVASLSVGLDAPGLIVSEGLVTGFSSGRVVASNIFNGTTFWEKRAFRPAGRNEIERMIDIDASPVLAGNVIIVGSYQGGLVSYQIRDGKEVWRNGDVPTRKNIAVSGNRLGVTGPQSELAAIDAESGATLWKKTTLRGNGLSNPVIAGQSMIVGTMDGDLFFVDLDNGMISSRFRVGTGPITSLLKVSQGVLVYSAGSGKLTLISGGY